MAGLLELYRRATGFYQLRSRMEGIERAQSETLDVLSRQHEQIAAVHDLVKARMEGIERTQSETLDVLSRQREQIAAVHDLAKPTPEDDVERATAVEITACRAIADRCIFIWGPARSNTTILTEIINTSKDALLLAEANLYAPKHEDGFSTWYNTQHRSFDNQVSKSTYAPHFNDGGWLEWLQAASQFYERVGDKMAFTNHQFAVMPTDQIRAFFEARFFAARHIFTFRDPVQTLLSTAHLFRISEDATLRPYIVGWLKTAQLWADCVRTFPNTLTVADPLSPATVTRLAEFLALDLTGADRLLDQSERRRHTVPDSFTTLRDIEGELSAVYADIQATVDADPVLWQADQKRSLALNDTRTDSNAGISLAPQPIGQVWARAEHLISELSA